MKNGILRNTTQFRNENKRFENCDFFPYTILLYEPITFNSNLYEWKYLSNVGVKFQTEKIVPECDYSFALLFKYFSVQMFNK